ncbi:DMT family transporter [Pelosinus propionicus]|uniref:Permease of the drug/metabolite transporter (DMT) superfamily n=1 Tax=Pelosinus propionicus DSM 13327 TaxID=1123291 RepID=A0A1I4I8L6_9FIRM|nr:DMT family transporter [Pelosinus propionicus]SFL50670.1 Permease of the drug/metabolite transporter (DMT) superfamily [Pelosinus propionicus DSM 13327]
MDDNGDKKVAYAAAVLYAFIIGFSFLFVKLALTVSDPIDTLAHRFTASFLAILVPFLLGKIHLSFTKKDIVQILPLALLYPALFFGFQITGLVYTTSSEAGIILASTPVLTMFLASYFLKEKNNYLQNFSLALSVAGVIYILIMKGAYFETQQMLGTSLLFLSSLSFAGYSVLARPLTQKFKPLELTFLMLTIAFFTFNLFALIRHGMNSTIHEYFQPLSDPIFLVSILYLGVLSSLGTSWLSNYVLSKIEASKMSVFGNLATLISMIAGVIFLQEHLEYYHIIGAIMIIAGILGTNLL